MDRISELSSSSRKRKFDKLCSYELGHTKYIAYRVSACKHDGHSIVSFGTSYRRSGRGPWMPTKRELSIPLEYWNELPKYLADISAAFESKLFILNFGYFF